METPETTPETTVDPGNNHLANVHASTPAEQVEEKKSPGIENQHLSDAIAGKVNAEGDSIEEIHVDDLPTHVGGIKLEHEFGNDANDETQNPAPGA